MTSPPKTRMTADLAASEVASLLAHHGISAGPASPLSRWPDAPPATDERDLRKRGLLDSTWGTFLEVLARPAHQLRVVVPAPEETLVSLYYGGRGCEGLVGCTETDRGLRISHPWTSEDLASLAAFVLCSPLPPPPENTKVELRPAGLAALAAALDLLKARWLDALTTRQVVADPSLDPQALAMQLALGSTRNDTRWLVTLLRFCAPPALAPAPEDLEAGLEELTQAGLVRMDDGHYWASDLVQRLALYWRVPLPALSHGVITRSGDGLAAAGHRIVIRGDGPLWTLDYQGLVDGDVRIQLAGTDPARYLSNLESLLEMPELAEPRETKIGSCSSCGVELKPDVQFCSKCGEKAPAPPQVPEPGGDQQERKRFCAACGKPVRPGAGFCAQCGAPTRA